MRPAHLARDASSSLSVLLHALAYVERQERYHPDIVAFLQPTSPFRGAPHIDAAIALLLSSDVESVNGICEVEQHPFVMFEPLPDGTMREFIRMQAKPLRRQEFPPLFVDNASMVVSRRRYYDGRSDPAPVHNQHSMKSVVMDRVSSIDIDTEFDFLVAQAALSTTAVDQPSGSPQALLCTTVDPTLDSQEQSGLVENPNRRRSTP